MTNLTTTNPDVLLCLAVLMISVASKSLPKKAASPMPTPISNYPSTYQNTTTTGIDITISSAVGTDIYSYT